MFKLKDRIDYIGGTIAKDTILHNSGGMAVIMAVDKGLEIPTHSANADVLVQILDGSMEFTLEGSVIHMSKGDALTMSPGQKHSLKATERFKVLVTKLNV